MTTPASVLTFDDLRLTRLMLQDPQRCATVNEYAGATGITVGRILELLTPALEKGELVIESVGGEIFVHTAPHGRPPAAGMAAVPANLWETLRQHRDSDTAFALWRLIRGLEHGGWSIEADPTRIPVAGGHTTFLGLTFARGAVVPLLILPEPAELAGPASPLSRYEHEKIRLVGIALRNGELEANATAVRRWMLERPHANADLHVLLLEAPRYQPVLLGGGDAAVTPRAVTRVLVEDLAAQ